MNFKSNEEITNQDLDQIHNYAISLYEEITLGGYEDLDKTRIKNRIRHLVEIIEKDEKYINTEKEIFNSRDKYLESTIKRVEEIVKGYKNVA